MGISAEDRRGGITLITVSGELDLLSAPPLRDLVTNAIAGGNLHLVIDLNQLTFLDSTGLGVLIAAFKKLDAEDGSVRLVCSQPRFLKMLHIFGLDRVFTIHPSQADALAETSGTATAATGRSPAR